MGQVQNQVAGQRGCEAVIEGDMAQLIREEQEGDSPQTCLKELIVHECADLMGSKRFKRLYGNAMAACQGRQGGGSSDTASKSDKPGPVSVVVVSDVPSFGVRGCRVRCHVPVAPSSGNGCVAPENGTSGGASPSVDDNILVSGAL